MSVTKIFKLIFLLTIVTLISVIYKIEAARILAVFPTPVISHQKVHRAIIHELIAREHEVVLITPFPEYTDDDPPENLMEIDVSNVSKEIWELRHIPDKTGINNYAKNGIKHVVELGNKIIVEQFKDPQVQSLIKNNETFDLLLLEAWLRPVLFWTYIYDAPVVTVSSMGACFNDLPNLGGFTHPLLYPTSFNKNVETRNIWEKVAALYEYWNFNSLYNDLEVEENKMAKALFGDVPPLREQINRIEMLLLNNHPMWHGVQPTPMNVVYLGGAHLQDRELKNKMTKELKQHLDSCISGVIYVSFGSNTRSWLIPEPTQRVLIQAFSELPRCVIWKWDVDIPGLPGNVKVRKWFPQAELLKHPNVRLFVSQCGQQSTDEAINAGVPLLAIPQAADQWMNTHQVLRRGIGATVDLTNVNHEQLKNIIEVTMRNESYRNNMQRLRSIFFDAPSPAPVRAAQAIEYVLRHSALLTTAPSRHVPWYQYMEIELLLYVAFTVLFLGLILCKVMYWIIKRIARKLELIRLRNMYSDYNVIYK